MRTHELDSKAQSLYEHLGELRSRLIKCVYILIIATGVCYGFSEQIFNFVRAPISPYLQGGGLIYVELRWGANSKEELASCQDIKDANKMRWYKAQQTLRNQMARDTNIFTGYSLEELELNRSKLGPEQPSNFDLIQILDQTL